MGQNALSDPWVGQTLWWTGTPGRPVIPAIVTAVTNGVPTLTTISGATLTNEAGTTFDPSRQTANSWSWPDLTSPVGSAIPRRAQRTY
jgi:hypothetical protein